MTKRKEKFISLISLISVLGIAIGVMALIVVIAVMSGFDRDLRDKIVGNYSHITVTGFNGLDESRFDNLKRSISSNPHVKAISPFVQGQVLLKREERFFAVSLKGIDPLTEPKVTRVAKYLKKGDIRDLKDNTIMIGRELAAYLDLGPGDEVSVYSPQGKEYKLKLVGVFDSGMYDYDLNLTFTNIKTAQDMFGLKGLYSAAAISLDNMYLADKVRDQLSAALGFNYSLKTWMEANKNFFAALKLEKMAMFIILALIVLVASFNIVSTLVVMVVEKTKDVGILKALGMTSSQVRSIFTFLGFLIGGLGTLFGTLGGLGLCFLLKKYQFIKLPQDIYYIDKMPVSLTWTDIGSIIAAALCITLVATIYPAAKAANLKPVEALRYE